MRCVIPCHLVALVTLFGVLAAAPASRADPPPAGPLPREEQALDPYRPLPWWDLWDPLDEAQSSVSLAMTWKTTDQGQEDIRGTILLELPTAAWLDGQHKAKTAKAPKAHRASTALGAARRDAPPAPAPAPVRQPARAAPVQDEEPCPETAEDRAASPAESTAPRTTRSARRVPRIRPRDARAALRAAQRSAGLTGLRLRLDDLANRARWSSALPLLRVRVTGLLDESYSLSPTSYDAQRTTASDGSSVWLEGRATWKLDRALFADEEVRLEKLRYRLTSHRRKLTRQVLDLLFAWQHAIAVQLDPLSSVEQCEAASLQQHQLAIELDLGTGGWFTRWARRRAERRPRVDCARR